MSFAQSLRRQGLPYKRASFCTSYTGLTVLLSLANNKLPHLACISQMLLFAPVARLAFVCVEKQIRQTQCVADGRMPRVGVQAVDRPSSQPWTRERGPSLHRPFKVHTPPSPPVIKSQASAECVSARADGFGREQPPREPGGSKDTAAVPLERSV